jgi:hypothetical protein
LSSSVIASSSVSTGSGVGLGDGEGVGLGAGVGVGGGVGVAEASRATGIGGVGVDTGLRAQETADVSHEMTSSTTSVLKRIFRIRGSSPA